MLIRTLVMRDIHDHTYTGEQAVMVDTGDVSDQTQHPSVALMKYW